MSELAAHKRDHGRRQGDNIYIGGRNGISIHQLLTKRWQILKFYEIIYISTKTVTFRNFRLNYLEPSSQLVPSTLLATLI